MIRYFRLSILIFWLFACSDPCEYKVKAWKDDALKALNNIKDANLEIINHPEIFNKGRDGKLHIDNQTIIEQAQKDSSGLYKLQKWLSDTSDMTGSKRSIWLEDETVLALFKRCIYKSISYDGFLYYSKTGLSSWMTNKNWKQSFQFTDSMSLGDNWYYVLRRCDGCAK